AEKKPRWKACPICWDSVCMSDMRPVRWYQDGEGEAPLEGGDVVLRLITRKSGSILALPRDGAESSPKSDDLPWHFAADVMDYARIMKGSEDYMLSSFDREIREINSQEQEDQLMFGEEDIWTRKAISTIGEMREKTLGIGNPRRIVLKKASGDCLKTPISQINQPSALRTDALSALSISSMSPSSSLIEPAMDDLNSSETKSPTTFSMTRDSGSQPKSDPHFFFYQALLHYYLSPLDIRILKAAFGDYCTFPATILPRVERISTGHIVDDDLRRRAKYLSHLPSGCEVSFLECDWTDIVPPSILEGFAGEITRRRRRNREKDVKEEKERMRAEKEEDDKRWAMARRKRPSLSKAQEDTFMRSIPEAPCGTPELEELGTSATSSSPPWGLFSRHSGSVFASLASPSTSPSAPRTVWGTAAIHPSSPQSYSTQTEKEGEHDGWLHNWEEDLFQDDNHLVSQVDASSVQDYGGPTQPRTTLTSKKKKGKKITLMSTNARRAA
ncbi:MAG: hypothetical protein MMC23_010165, partial [Stictis urceolatum]|nr:hypothetical protein [Stictis urceolata]